jgi:ABC-type antimicrobial peptide transport system permease subunit
MIGRGIAGSLPLTPLTLSLSLFLSTVAFALVGTIAMLVPARRALRVAPAVALRVE